MTEMFCDCSVTVKCTLFYATYWKMTKSTLWHCNEVQLVDVYLLTCKFQINSWKAYISHLYVNIYIYNSVCASRHKHINSFASAHLNASQIDVMKGSHWRKWMVGPEILFSIYQCCFLVVFCVKWLHKAVSNQTNLASAKLCRSAGGTRGGPT